MRKLKKSTLVLALIIISINVLAEISEERFDRLIEQWGKEFVSMSPSEFGTKGMYSGKFSELLKLSPDFYPKIVNKINQEPYGEIMVNLWFYYTKTGDSIILPILTNKNDIVHWWAEGRSKSLAYFNKQKRNLRMGLILSIRYPEEKSRYLDLVGYCKTNIRRLGTLALPHLIDELKKPNSVTKIKDLQEANSIFNKHLLNLAVTLVKQDISEGYPSTQITKNLLINWWKDKGHKLYLTLPQRSRPCKCAKCKKIKKK